MDKAKIEEAQEKLKRLYYSWQYELDSLKAVLSILDLMKKDYLPKLPETKKTAQEAVKELCAALCEFAENV